MPVRYATRRYPDLVSFLGDYEANLGRGIMVLPSGTLADEPAPELKVDVVLPGPTRIGPLEAQVLRRLVDGSIALQLTKVPEALGAAAAQAEATVEQIKAWLLARGRVGPPVQASAAEVERLAARVGELEEALARAEAARLELARVLAAAQARLADAGGHAQLGDVSDGAVLGSPQPPLAGTGAAGTGAAGIPGQRGFPLPNLAGREPRLSGTVGTLEFRQALMALAVERATGLLTLRSPDGRTRWGFWSKGGPVGWRSEPIDEQEVLGVLLLRANQLTKDQLRQSLDIMEARGCRQGEALIEMGVLTFAQLVMLLQKQTEFVVQRVLAAREGTWTFHDVSEHAERFMPPPVRVAALLFRALRTQAKELPTEELSGALRPHFDQYIYLAAGVERTLEEMRLSGDEQMLMKIVAGTSYRLRELSSVSSLSRSATATMVYCLLQLGLLEFRDEEAAARGGGRLARDLLSRKMVAQKGTLFDRLEVHWICTGAEVEAAWRRLSAQFSVDEPNRYGEEWRETVELIARGLVEAYERLRTDTRRREYRAEVIERSMVEQSAMMLAGKGDMELLKSNNREAFECYAKAVELIPNSGEYTAGLQKARAAAGA